MVAARALLDPTARDPELRAFAYLQARFVKGARSAVDCLQPFVMFAIGQFDGQAFDQEKVIRFLSDNYQINIPRYMLEDMAPHLVRLGALKKQDMANVVTCHNVVQDESGPGGEVDFSLDQISEAEAALEAFAKRQDITEPYSSDNWGEALVAFFQADTAGQRSRVATIDGMLVSETAFFDNKVVADFVIEAHRSGSSIYPIIEKIFYGVLVSEFLVRIESAGNKAEYDGLEVVYDTPVLLRLLGTSGTYLRTATLEMHETLQDLGCRTFYYNHTFTEMLNALDYIIQAYGTGSEINAETQRALEAGEITIGQITSVYSGPDAPLGQLGVTEHPNTYEDREEDEFQINEQGFMEELTRAGRYRFGAAAPEYDAKSLALTMRLRRGKSTRKVADAHTIFVTQNSFLARRSRHFLFNEGMLPSRTIGPVLTVGQMTTVGWLANEIIFEPTRVSKELIANCYKASLPMDGWGSAFWEAMNEADPATAQDITNNALLVRSVQEIAQQETRGHIGLIKKLNLNDLLTQAEEKSAELQNEARSSGRAEGREEVVANIASSSEMRAKEIAAGIARAVEVLLFLNSLVCLVLAYFFFESLGPVLGSIVSIALVLLGAVTAADVFRIKLRFSLRRFIERQALTIIKKAQQFFGGRPEF